MKASRLRLSCCKACKKNEKKIRRNFISSWGKTKQKRNEGSEFLQNDQNDKQFD